MMQSEVLSHLAYGTLGSHWLKAADLLHVQLGTAVTESRRYTRTMGTAIILDCSTNWEQLG